MADGADFQGTTPSYPPTDLKVSTDKSGDGHDIQRVKLAIATDGSETHIPADATDGLLVNLGANNDVTVTSLVPGTTATSLGKAIDTAIGATDTGVLAIAKRVDTLATITPANSDGTPLQVTSQGALWTSSDSPGHEYQEDATATTGDFGSLVLAVRNQDAATLTSADADYGAIAIDGAGRVIATERPPIVLTWTPTLDTAVYASGDTLHTTVATLANAHPRNGGWVRVLECTVLDKSSPSGANNPAPLDLLFFSASITPGTVNTASAISDADMANCIGKLTLGDYATTTINSFGQRSEPGVYLHLGSGTTSLYVSGIVRGTPTYAASDLVFTLILAPYA